MFKKIGLWAVIGVMLAFCATTHAAEGDFNWAGAFLSNSGEATIIASKIYANTNLYRLIRLGLNCHR